MKGIIAGALLGSFCGPLVAGYGSLPTKDSIIWKFSASEDRFAGETTYTAKTAYDQVVGFTDQVGFYETEYMSLGLRCDVTEGVVKSALLSFSFEMPLAYYSAPVDFMVMVGADGKVFRFDGKMFANSMSSGYASIKDHDDLPELLDELSRGKGVTFKIDPRGKGEDREESLTLKGSANAIAQWKQHCL
jgi:hypothetical protein